MNKPRLYTRDNDLIRAAMEAARLEMEDDLHPLNHHAQEMRDAYFGLGKVRTIKPKDQNLLAREDHEALDRMHSRLSLILDTAGRREDSQSHLAAANWHATQALGKPNAAQQQAVKTERLLNVPRVAPSPFRKGLVDGEKAQRGPMIDVLKAARTPGQGHHTAVVVIPNEDGTYEVAGVGPGVQYRNENVTEQRLPRTVDDEAYLRQTARTITGRRKFLSNYPQKRYLEKLDSLGRRRCWRDGMPVKCPNRGGKGDGKGDKEGRKTSYGGGGPQNVSVFQLIKQTLEALSQMPDEELQLTFQRLGGRQDVSGPALEISKQAVEETLHAPKPEPEERPITDKPAKGEKGLKAIGGNNRTEGGGSPPTRDQMKGPGGNPGRNAAVIVIQRPGGDYDVSGETPYWQDDTHHADEESLAREINDAAAYMNTARVITGRPTDRMKSLRLKYGRKCAWCEEEEREGKNLPHGTRVRHRFQRGMDKKRPEIEWEEEGVTVPRPENTIMGEGSVYVQHGQPRGVLPAGYVNYEAMQDDPPTITRSRVEKVTEKKEENG